MSFSDRIHCDPKILSGKPVIKGSRLAVSFILELLESGDTLEEIAREYKVSIDDIKACIEYARFALESDHLLSKSGN